MRDWFGWSFSCSKTRFIEFSKEEKTDLLHIAICRLLSNYGFYELEGRDKEGWPHYTTNENLPPLKPGEQTILMKEAAIVYFEESGVQL